MDIYITFYIIKSVGSKQHGLEKTKKDTILLNNGFSFGREKKPEDIDLFFNTNDINITKNIQEKIDFYKPNKIWVSVSFNDECFAIKDITDDRWIIGGPVVFHNKNNDIFNKFFSGNPTFVYTSMEEYLGKSISDDFDPYFLDFIKTEYPDHNVLYNISLGLYGCYWARCKFCRFKDTKTQYKRDNIKKIIQSAIPYNSNIMFSGIICLSSPEPEILDQILNSKKKDSIIQTYIRPDKLILNKIKKYNDLSKIVFIIGSEGFSQLIINKLNKGFKINTMLEIIEEILKRNGIIRLAIMKNYVFLTEDIINEYKNNIKKIETIIKKYCTNNDYSKIKISSGVPVLWPNKEDAEENGFKSIRLKDMYKIPPFTKEYYISIIPKNNKQYILNEKIKDILDNSIIPQEHGYGVSENTYFNKK